MGETLHAALANTNPEYGEGGSWKTPLFFRARQAWRRRAPSATRPPLPWAATLAIADWMLDRDMRMEALFVLTCFTTYFRPSDALSLLVCDLLCPVGSQRCHALRLHPPERGVPSKTRQFENGVQLDSAIFPCLGHALQSALRDRPPVSSMFPFIYHHISRTCDLACLSLHINHACLYRLRHGGCSHDLFHRLRSMAECKKQGRWTCDDSLRRYQKPIALMKEEQNLPRWMMNRRAELEAKLTRELQGIPRRREPGVQQCLVAR